MEKEKSEKNYPDAATCPACTIIDRFGDKWSLLVLVKLNENGILRFNQILKITPGISQKMLTTTLKTLEADKLINRKMYPEIPPRVEYKLTDLGKSLIPHLENLIDWAKEHATEILDHRNTLN